MFCTYDGRVNKLFSISLDNATTNTSAMQFLKEDPSIKLVLNGSLMHVRCCTHKLNLSVQDGLDELRTFLEPIRNEKSNRLRYPHLMEFNIRVIAYAIAYRAVFTDMYNESRATDGQFITNDHWSLAKIVHDVLETFDNATHTFSYFMSQYTYG
ncbi:putative AC9 transposase [Bienertia sinuspersici]